MVPVVNTEGALRCSFCDHEEKLPLDAAQRAKALDRRLKEVSWMREAREGPALGIGKMAADYAMGLRMGLVMVGIVMALVTLAALGTVFSTGWLAGALVFIVPAAFIAISSYLFIGNSRALNAYAAELQPLLEAVPSRVGAALGCRSCGAPITATTSEGAFVACSFCNTQNLIGQRDAQHQAALLAGQLQDWQAASRGDQTRLQAAIKGHAGRLNFTTLIVLVGMVLIIFSMLLIPSLFLSS